MEPPLPPHVVLKQSAGNAGGDLGGSLLLQAERLGSFKLVCAGPHLRLIHDLDQARGHAHAAAAAAGRSFDHIVDPEVVAHLTYARMSPAEAHDRSSGYDPEARRGQTSELAHQLLRQAIDELIRLRPTTQILERQRRKHHACRGRLGTRSVTGHINCKHGAGGSDRGQPNPPYGKGAGHDPVDVRKKSISTARNGLDEPGRVGVIVQRRSNLGHAYVEVTVKIDEGSVAPDFFLEFFSGEELSRVFSQ